MPPLKWSATENIAWQVDVPGRGHASPIVVGEQVFVATADDAKSTHSLLAYRRADGYLLWNEQIHHGRLPESHEKGSHASCTPASDGERVFTVFAVDDGIWVSAVDFAGELLWQRKIGGFLSRHGYGASPVLYKSLVIAAADGVGPGYIVALDRVTGEVVWRTPRRREASFATPIVAHVAGRDQLLLSGQDQVVSYNPATGEELWTCQGSASSTANTCVASDDHVFASGGWHQTGVMCIRADGAGDVTATHVVWSDTTKMYVPSPAIIDNTLLVVRDDGIVVGFDTATGDKLWAKRLPGGIGVSASPTIVDGNLAYLPNEEGTTFVFRVGEKFKLLAANELGDGGFASPVIAGGRIYMRTLTKLWCIASEQPTP
jgi:outer membrane protein assembly factor BamB